MSTVSTKFSIHNIIHFPASVDGMKRKIARSGRSFYCCIHMQTFRTVCLLRNLSLDGKLCLRDDRSDASALSSPYLAVANKHGRHHA